MSPMSINFQPPCNWRSIMIRRTYGGSMNYTPCQRQQISPGGRRPDGVTVVRLFDSRLTNTTNGPPSRTDDRGVLA